MAKITNDESSAVFESLGSNGSTVIVTVSKNADGTPVKAPHK